MVDRGWDVRWWGDDVGSRDSNENAQSSKYLTLCRSALMHVTAFFYHFAGA